nr:hypothetical protein [Pseudomonas karstica]
MGAIFASVFSLVFAVPLFFDSYFRNLPLADNAKYSFLGGIALTVVIVHCNFMIARGRPQWVWPLVVLLGLCFLGVLPTIEYRPHKLIYGLSAFLPLLALLLLNSKRHREMRAKLLEIRHLRQAAIAKHKSR